MSNQLARPNGSTLSSLENGAPWLPLRSIFGFDPFQAIRASYGFEYDVTRTEKGYDVEVPVPGYTASEIDVTFKDGIVTIVGKSDRRSFTRSFTVPDDVDADAMEAVVRNGMLTLSLQRYPETQPKKIEVK
jgi:HSP20 family molecular chaperone IbpA